jgi:glycosyltransferase involved in cell wall biosynthesis
LRIAVVHNGVSEALPIARQRAIKPTIVCLGRLVPHKQVDHLLQAAAQLREEFPDLRVRVVGDGWWADHLRADAAAMAVDDLVEFTGFVDDAQKAKELADAWVLAIPSLKEGWGLVVVEAATYAVPAIGYRSAAGVAESIVDGVTGLVVDGGNQEFTEALRRLLRDSRLRDELGRAAEERAALFSRSTTAEEFGAVLAGVFAGTDGIGSAMVDSSRVTNMRPVTLGGPDGSPGNWG